jgi:uncharacterized protein (TIGR02452 family)
MNFDKIQVWNDTYNYFLNDNITTVPESKKYRLKKNNPNLNIKKYNTEIQIIRNDIIDTALDEKRNGNKVLILNMADINVPGGCVKAGSGAQEECLFRRSNYYKHLRTELYPILGSDIIHSKNVKFIKNNERMGNTYMDTPEYLDIMAIPALRFPQLNSSFNGYMNISDKELMFDKIEAMFKLGCYGKYDVLVLSAFGCGAYGNPPLDVIKIFNEIIRKYDGQYKKIIFSILGANYNIFLNNINKQ